MKLALVTLIVVVVGYSMTAAEPSSFGHWSAKDLSTRERALSTKVGADHSSRETLADYGDHRFRLLYRDADGLPEQHDGITDVVIVQSGEGVLQLGGTMVATRDDQGYSTRLEFNLPVA